MARDGIIIVGAGIIGLDVALTHCQRGFGKHITIIGSHLPGDLSIEYTSPWAGVNFSAISGPDANAFRWDDIGYNMLMKAIEQDRPEAKYIAKMKSTEFWDIAPDSSKIASMKAYLRDFSVISAHKLPEGVAFGVNFTTLILNAPMHLIRLASILQEQYGVTIERRTLARIGEAFDSPQKRAVFNCIGNAARTLPGVEDANCYPIRGQIVMVKARAVQENIMCYGRDYETYVIPRPSSDGKVILGGYMQKGVGTGDVYGYETESILARTAALLPNLKSDYVEVISAAAGLRLSSIGGARVERYVMPDGRPLVHNYGAGGTGYQAGLGIASEAVELAGDVLREIFTQSKL